MTKKEKQDEINIPEILNNPDLVDLDEEDDEEEENIEKLKISRQVEITTPYVSVTVTTEHKDDNMKSIVKTAEKLMDKYKYHHLIKD